MQSEEDYEVYETTRRVLGRFPGDRFARWLFDALPEFRRRRGEDDVDDFLAAVAAGNLGPEAIRAFNDAWTSADPVWSAQLLEIVERLERRGSLSAQGRSEKLRPSNSYSPRETTAKTPMRSTACVICRTVPAV